MAAVVTQININNNHLKQRRHKPFAGDWRINWQTAFGVQCDRLATESSHTYISYIVAGSRLQSSPGSFRTQRGEPKRRPYIPKLN